MGERVDIHACMCGCVHNAPTHLTFSAKEGKTDYDMVVYFDHSLVFAGATIGVSVLPQNKLKPMRSFMQ